MTKGTQAERIATLEARLDILKEEMRQMAKQSEERHADMSKKLDELLGLKQKGVGAFWLASTLTGVGILGFIGAMLEKWKGFFTWISG